MTSPARNGEALLDLRGIGKRFPGVQALAEVDFDLRRGEVHSIVGENGAGKSTLIKILTGVHQPDAGSYAIDGRPAAADSPRAAIAAGISVVYQEPKLVPTLSVAENIFFGRLPSRRGRVAWRRLHEEAAAALDQVGLRLDPRRQVRHLGIGEQQLVEVAQALTQSARVLILDEPTSALSPREIERLFALIRRLKQEGVAIVYVSHKLEEILALSDRVSVLRDGRLVRTAPVEELDGERLISLMVGRPLESEGAPAPAGSGVVALEVRNLSTARVRDVSFRAHRGEIVGFSGLMGAGRTELARAVLGADRRHQGEIEVVGHRLLPDSTAAARRLGVGLVPEDRRGGGLFPEQPVLHNMTVAALDRFCSRGVISPSRERAAAAAFVEELSIRTPSLRQRIAVLSGGNQQKVLVARWLLKQNLEVLFVDEPTRGIDVRARFAIYRLLREMANRGLAVIVISSEIPELLRLCNRIYVMKGGCIVGELPGAGTTPEELLARAI